MAEQQNPSDSEKTKKKQRGLRGLQRLPLKKTIELAQAVLEEGQGEPVPRVIALEHLGRSPSAGSSGTLVGASSAYGLTRASGDRLELTERGRILVDPTRSDSEKLRTAYDALFSSEIFTALVLRFAEKQLPSDAIVLDYLRQTHQLSREDAQVAWNVFRANLGDYNLVRDLSNGKKMVLSRETVEGSLAAQEPKTAKEPASFSEESPEVESSSQPLQGVKPSYKLEQIQPEFHFNIQIHLPADAKPEQYDAIFKSIATYLLRRTEEQLN